ncbi:DUF6199 family natural product biosynthesis protein [Paenibacillus sp. FSL H7-0942]|uniref:DUF6199 family natural product biosynthesis protein n=1 Tax=Paenibacillus TaxID=44249 RepID=UPI0003E1D0F5|nr:MULTISPECIES: DUF6199 family natural product biosynthesis protein [Paenibacillus]ETT35161.1 hypothetical protein C161_18194 [Paenibacillus sp. FSL R5-192]OME91836.1 hypothetical protein BK124_27115 [Paenibacillus amylolyticus]OMF02770.1 hypothetical protein BK129_24075 [Paenibacillus amylolyticus]
MTGIIGVFVLIIGLIMAIWPYFAWYIRLGWKFKDAEPSDLALSAGRISGMINPTILSEEEKNTVIQMIQDAELRPFDAGDVFGSNNDGKITFTDETSLDIVIFGPSGGIELHPKATEKEYEIMSEELKNWFHTNYSD